MAPIPDYFYINGMLHKKLAVIRSDSSVYAFCFQEERPVFLNLIHTKKYLKKAFTVPQAANMMNVSSAKLKDLFKAKLYKWPEESYDLNSYRPIRIYINEDDMLEIRQLLWDLLPKNKYGIPYNDNMASEEELIHAMRSQDDRDYVRVDGDMIRIYRA